MENITTSQYVKGGDQASSRSENTLPGPVEAILKEIYLKHNLGPINDETRKRLSLVPEELASDTLRKVLNSPQVKTTLDRFIKFLLDQATNGSSQSPAARHRPREEMSLDSEAPSPKCMKRESYGGSQEHIPPEILALGELEFKKAFLLLSYIPGSYIPGKSLAQVITADEIRQWKDLSMVAYEAAVWERLGQLYCSQTDRRLSLEWDSGKTHYYQCHVALDGSYTLKGPLLEPAGTHLHKVFGDDNVLTVKFADVQKNSSTYSNDPYSAYKRIAKDGIRIGLRRYQFFVYKDGGKEEKKKDFSTNGVKCYFIRTDSTSANDLGTPYIFSGKSIHEARKHFMHVHKLPSLAKFSLILSKTKKLEVDMAGITFEEIDDIHCLDQNNKDVLDKNGKPCIHSDGTGYISEDLARMCPVNIYKGKGLRSDSVQGACNQDPPLLIQFRMFYEGYAVKGTFLLNKKIKTLHVRSANQLADVLTKPLYPNPFRHLLGKMGIINIYAPS